MAKKPVQSKVLKGVMAATSSSTRSSSSSKKKASKGKSPEAPTRSERSPVTMPLADQVQRILGPVQERRSGVSWRLKTLRPDKVKRILGPTQDLRVGADWNLRSVPDTGGAAGRVMGPQMAGPEVMLGPEDPRSMAGPTPPSRAVRLGRKYGIGALAALAGIGAGVGAFRNLTREVEGKLAEDAFLEFRNAQRRQVIDQEADRARRESLQAAIDLNLQRVAQADPAMYAQVMAGRRLPQGAVVLGGEQRTDLLQELGRAMAEGRFTQ